MTDAGFGLDSFAGPAQDLHDADLLAAAGARVVRCLAASDALVLGSSQPTDLADATVCAQERVTVVRRRSGGGAVLVEPDAMVWFDVVLPAGDRRFAAVADDVRASMVWLGRHLDRALATLGVAGTTVHDGPLAAGDWSRLVCFGGVGGGEVLLDGVKLVGVSQRRRRDGARFQCMVHTAWNPERTVRLLRQPRPAASELPPVATLPAAVADALPAALVESLSAG